jgi:CxxC-x17-CxxC domain-containing protein
MDETVRDAVFGNIGTLISFRVGAEDAEYLEKEFVPEFTAQDIVNLAKYNIYLKLMIDGVAGRPFSAETLIPFPGPEVSNKEKIINVSRERYGTPRKEVEEKIIKWLGLSDAPNISVKTSEPPVLYDVVCSMCNKPTKVVFSPDGKRPVYCKTCLKKTRAGEEKTNKQEPVSLEKAIKEDVVPFSRKRKRKEVNLSELRETLNETLEKKDNENS